MFIRFRTIGVVGLMGFLLLLTVPLASRGHTTQQSGSGSYPDKPHPSRTSDTTESVAFPRTKLFAPLVADPKHPRFFASYLSVDSDEMGHFTLGSVGYGEDIQFYRGGPVGPFNHWQVGLSGGLFSQFNIDRSSDDLINTDFRVGFPFTFRANPYSMRIKIYHQSSHLGDEFLLRQLEQVENIEELKNVKDDLAYESVEVLLSYKKGSWRVYFGGEHLVHTDPSSLDKLRVQGGFEFERATRFMKSIHWIGALDVKSFEETDWEESYSGVVGIEFGLFTPRERNVRILLESFDGPSPWGQFFTEKIQYLGLGVHLNL